MDVSAMLLYMAVTMITPGPNNLTMMYLSARYGFRGTGKYFLGSALSLLAKTLLCGGLNVLLADLLPALVGWLKWLGAAYMLYLAWVMGRSGFRPAKAEEERGGGAGFASGVLLQCLNMKSWISALTLFAVYVIPYSSGAGVILWVSLAFVAIMAAASALWGLCGSAMRRLYEAYRKPFGLLMAASLVYCALTAVL